MFEIGECTDHPAAAAANHRVFPPTVFLFLFFSFYSTTVVRKYHFVIETVVSFITNKHLLVGLKLIVMHTFRIINIVYSL
jgi:hypothetical protein